MMDKIYEKSQNKFSISMPVQYLKGVGPAKAKIFSKIGVETVGELLEYFPRDWVFAPEPIKIGELKEGQQSMLIGQIESTDFGFYRKPAVFEAMVSDETGVCRLLWFHGSFLQNQLQPGQIIAAWGKITSYKHQLQLTNPKFVIVKDEAEQRWQDFSGGVYKVTDGLSSGQIKRIIRPIIDEVDELVDEFFDKEFLKKNHLVKRQDAFSWIHLPGDEEKLAKAKRRLKYDELFLMQLGLALRRFRVKHFGFSAKMLCDENMDSRIRKRFPFLLTGDQNSAISEIVSDLAREEPMNRLLQGDVGSGKTVVALYAALLAVGNKAQVVIMAPTEILAQQHFISIERYLRSSQVQRVCITGGITGKTRKELLGRIKMGEINIVVGTVALLQDDIEFKNLGLVIIDEQHKFGVHQRRHLRGKNNPHCLVMTATPIPRTLAMTAFGDLDVSVIKHSPPGRGKVETRWVDTKHRKKAYEFIRERLKAGKQAYFVYPRILGTEENGIVKAATDEWEKLSKEIFPEFKVALLHGRMAADAKQLIMNEFRKGKIKVLVSTVVVEVGVDVPNATIMVIETADRFGLAQLHQLRGRIGRGASKSFCFLFAETENETAQNRLNIMVKTNDGFKIAEQDLKLRGPGEFFSVRQHGLPDLKIADIIDDYELLVLARKDAFKMVDNDPMLKEADHKNIRKALLNKFGDSIGLVDVA